MATTPDQLALDLAHRPATGRDDFLVSQSNAAAVKVVDSWPSWPQRTLAIVGPAGSGKSHLVEVWRARAGGLRIAASDLTDDAVAAATAAGVLALEDIDRGIADERVLFHLLNLARELKLSLLLTSRVALGEIAVALPDLRSRLRAVGFVSIAEPDEALLGALLVKLFADRQLAVSPRVVSILARNLDRSAEAAARAVELIDRQALATRRKVGPKLAAAVVRELTGSSTEADLEDEDDTASGTD